MNIRRADSQSGLTEKLATGNCIKNNCIIIDISGIKSMGAMGGPHG